ncbi:hypothetical protein UH38_11575 [Aliterella atlantica CENA595]|uniref:Uncharacterized protein n=1 Tax=Aliterella atlantica CENA595 TaxID=1618023 RepID=A0A0D8ZWU5_9CYAN|nr:Shedu anti-phage system protein SduA domain-containing protein [Aliterella atlantica]KJH71686.1 hypothetical protein UH38_11575 [Aliterella atlantica CENA595]
MFVNANKGDFPPEEYRVDPHNVTGDDIEKLITLIRKNAGETEIDLLLKNRLPLLSLTSSFFSTGHHRSWIIPQARIKPSGFTNGPGLRPDYLFAGENSDGVTWWVVDLKSPKDTLYKENGDGRIVETDKLRNAISQVDDYITYCTKHQGSIRNTLELTSFSSPYGIIIMGREAELKRDLRKQERKAQFNRRTHTIQIRTFDAFVREVEFHSKCSYKLPFLTKLYKSLFVIDELTHHDRWFIDEDLQIPTSAQLHGLYRISCQLTYMMVQPIHLICINNQTQNLYILAGQSEDIEFQITPTGEVL